MAKDAKKKRRRGQGKGSKFERDISKKLSFWWSNDKRDDIYWRTQASGARATMRNRATYGQYGDIQAVDPIGEPLTKLCTIELKCGYKGASMMDLVDRVGTQHPMYERFLEQVTGDAEKADTPYWLLIARRPQKATMVWMPSKLKYDLAAHGGAPMLSMPFVRIHTVSTQNELMRWKVVGTSLEEFFGIYRPTMFKKLLNEYED